MSGIELLRVNSIRNKFDSLVTIVNKNIDVKLIFDSSFPAAQFYTEGCTTPYRLNRHTWWRHTSREDIPSSLFNSDVSIKGFFVEPNLRKKKWLL